MKNLLAGNKLSLAVCGLVLSSSVAFAANTVDSAFKEGKASGSLALYGEKHDFKSGTPDSGFGNGNATVAFETASLYGFTAKAEFKGNLSLGEVEDNDYDGAYANHSLMTEAYVVIPEKPNKVPCLRALSQLFSYNIYYIIRPKVYISGRFR